jgi:hypothetical protein
MSLIISKVVLAMGYCIIVFKGSVWSLSCILEIAWLYLPLISMFLILSVISVLAIFVLLRVLSRKVVKMFVFLTPCLVVKPFNPSLSATDTIRGFIKSLIKEVSTGAAADRLGLKGLTTKQGVRKTNILTTFLDRTLSNTKMANTEITDNIKNMLIKGKYNQAISKIQDKDHTLPLKTIIQYPIANTTLEIMRDIDDIVKQRLLTLNQVQMSFVSTLLEKFRTMTSSEHKMLMGDIIQVNSTLDELFRHLHHVQQAKPHTEIVLLVITLTMVCLNLITLLYVKYAICNFFMHQKLNSEFRMMTRAERHQHAQLQNTHDTDQDTPTQIQ